MAYDRNPAPEFTFAPGKGVYFPPKKRSGWPRAILAVLTGAALGVTLLLLSGCETMEQRPIDPAAAMMIRQMQQGNRPVYIPPNAVSQPTRPYQPQPTFICQRVSGVVYCN